jgi:hypothetical protein
MLRWPFDFPFHGLMPGSDLFISGASFKTFHFAQSLRQDQILILEILNVFLWLKFLPSLTLNKLKHFETGSQVFEGSGSFSFNTM